MRIDAHQHFWRPSRGDYGWLTPQAHPAICRKFLPADLEPLLSDAGVLRTILVQAAPTTAETEYLLGLAAETAFVAGVVGWADFEAKNAAQQIAALAQQSKLVGLRPMLQDLDDDAWILRPAVGRALDAIEAAGLRFDALVTPRHLPHLARCLASRPALKVVIDHGAKPDIAGGGLSAWAASMRAIANETSANCKLSGLVTETGGRWSEETLKPYVDVLLEAFGPARLMWGSDWPVVNEAGGYAAWHSAAVAMTEGCSQDERDLIFGGSAQAFYGIAA
ncbi:MAG TPA: amidohydrolase family protein [Caulobacteraceae bacterium]|jgi:L-fuconolactonase|nr:amidohydrolase family protein [Caulobacteraceae bacterium]